MADLYSDRLRKRVAEEIETPLEKYVIVCLYAYGFVLCLLQGWYGQYFGKSRHYASTGQYFDFC